MWIQKDVIKVVSVKVSLKFIFVHVEYEWLLTNRFNRNLWYPL